MHFVRRDIAFSFCTVWASVSPLAMVTDPLMPVADH